MALGSAFTCVICGEPGVFQPVEDWREEPTCAACGSSVRMRSMVWSLLDGLLGRVEPLARLRSYRLIGAGLSDWDGYAGPLGQVFEYENTYYHREPRLDITAPGAHRLGLYDFLMSSDVFEHVPAPVSRAFEGAFAILRPGGLLVLTVPFADNPTTVEHYPDAAGYTVVETDGRFSVVLHNRGGGDTVDEHPVFHGGPGSTLEMRLFSRDGVVAELKAAGFADIRVHDRAVPEWGVFPRVHGAPITARKPASAADRLKNRLRRMRKGRQKPASP